MSPRNDGEAEHMRGVGLWEGKRTTQSFRVSDTATTLLPPGTAQPNHHKSPYGDLRMHQRPRTTYRRPVPPL